MSGSDEHVSSMGLSRREGFNDSDDYISIESGNHGRQLNHMISLVPQPVAKLAIGYNLFHIPWLLTFARSSHFCHYSYSFSELQSQGYSPIGLQDY